MFKLSKHDEIFNLSKNDEVFNRVSTMKIIIAGGGSGGHIYPAMSIAQALQKKNPEIKIIFVGTDQGLEKKIIPKAGYDLRFIQSGKLNFSGKFFEKLKSIIKIPIGLIQSLKLLTLEKPDFVLGVGGYASAPIVFVAALIGKKTALWEPNAHPGMANRILSRFIDKSYLVFSEAVKYLKSKNNLTLGMPLRSEIENANSEIKQKNNIFTILCFGGSQGSVFLNDKLSELINNNTEYSSKIKVIHQTGPRDFDRMKDIYKNNKNIEVYDYIYDMPYYYKQADLLFCRGGASTLAEAAAFGVVPVIVPLPAADDHQQKNAEALVKKNAGFIFFQKNFDSEKFKLLIDDLINNQNNLNLMSERLRKIVQIGAADRIAEDILNTLKTRIEIGTKI